MRAQPAPATWQPVLEGESAARARTSAQTVIDAIASVSGEVHPGLGGGRAGLALLFEYAARALGQPGLIDAAQAQHEQAIEALSEQVLAPALYSGFTGIALTHVQISRNVYGELDAEATAELDDALLQLLRQSPWHREYDLISGLVGYGIYALELLPLDRAARMLELIVERLAELAESTEAGITWHTAPHLLPPHQLAEHPTGYHNLGLAHGVPGAVALLAATVGHDLGGDTAKRLLEGSIDWMLAQLLPDDAVGCYSHVVDAEKAPQPCRLAWCYGDLGIACALLAAADCAGHARLRQLGLRVGRKAAAREASSAGVVDPPICHGGAGIAHGFNRLYQATRESAFLQAARNWFVRTLDTPRQEPNLGGYSAWETIETGKFGWVSQPGMLTGSGGIAATLLAAISDIEPAWDRFLEVSFARRAK